MACIRLFSILFIALCAASACGRPTSFVPAGMPLRDLQLVGSFVLPEQVVGNASDIVSELSGAWYDGASRRLLLVSDRRDRPALFTMHVSVAPAVRLVPERLTPIEPPVAQRTVDLEGIAPAPGGHVFVSSEGEDINPERPVSGIFEYTRDGTFIRRLMLPGAYSGMRPNAGLEGLSVSPERRRLFAATEGSLRQDGPAATFDAGATTRILVFDLERRGVPREYAYRTEPVPPLANSTTAKGDNGVSEILAIASDDLLVLERAYVEETASGARSANTVRIYRVHLEPAAEITGRWSLTSDPPKAVLTKTLVVDLASVADRLGERLEKLENFEAMAFGPPLPDGRGTLLLVSDNNCSDRQVTALVVFAFGSRD